MRFSVKQVQQKVVMHALLSFLEQVANVRDIEKRLASGIWSTITSTAKNNPLALASIIGVFTIIIVIAFVPAQFQNLVARLPYHTASTFTGQGDNHTSSVVVYGDRNHLEATCISANTADAQNSITITEQMDRGKVLIGAVACDGQNHELTFGAYGAISFVISALPEEQWTIIVRGEA